MTAVESRSRPDSAPATFDIEGCDVAPGLGGYYADDLLAIQAGARTDGLVYVGAAVTPGHAEIRNPAKALLIRLRSSDGSVGWGDAVTVQYSGFGGRELPIDFTALAPEVDLAFDALRGAGRVTFADGCALVEELRIDGRPLHSGVRYGLSQALLSLASATSKRSPVRILLDLLGERDLAPVPIYAQSGEERRRNVDKMIVKHVDVLPHGLINSPEAFGTDGEAFLAYATWVRDRIVDLGGDDYRPRLHFDVYGMMGIETGGDVTAMTRICERLVDACGPYPVQLESPAYGADADTTVRVLRDLHAALAEQDIPVSIVADDWCNTIGDITRFLDAGAADLIQIKMPDLGSLTNTVDAVLACRAAGAGVFIGGSCSETDVSARASVQLAVAAGAEQVLAKPGMGVDEALTVTFNEMQRACMS
ncbi:MAG: methylaspartate ammonia-lyase [Gaiellales bacterium]|jgi:methylaspartate ammonia-lyase|nr:methylaspartate ammonia-lyase [Gaiellales bacterium]